MKNLKLLQKLQASETVTLILSREPGGLLDYYIIAKTVNYSIVASGKCDGEINAPSRTFNILLSGLMPMIEKGYEFRIVYEDEVLRFVSKDERIVLTPMCVEYRDALAETILSKNLRYVDAISTRAQNASKIENLDREIREIQRSYSEIQRMHLDGVMQSSNPFTEDTVGRDIDKKFVPQIAESKAELERVQKEALKIVDVDLKPFRTLALAAARAHETINFCSEFAVVELKGSYVLQKAKCPTFAIQGQLLYQLMQFGDGEGFSWFENGLVFETGDTDKTILFAEKYLPNTAIDMSIVTRGVVLEKFIVTLKNYLSVATMMRGRFPDMTFDMGEHRLLLDNDKGEQLVLTFDEPTTDTLKMRKLIRDMSAGKDVSEYDTTMSKISISKEVQALLGLFREELVMYVKQRKVIFQHGNLYLVFGR